MPDSDRVPYVTDRAAVPADGREHYDSIAESRGRIVAPFAVLLNSPDLAGRVADVGAYIRFESELSDRDRELAILTTAREQACAFEWAAHVPIATDAGVEETAIEAIEARRDGEDLDPAASDLIAFCRELLAENRVSASTYESVHTRLGDRGVVELVATVGYYSMIACVLNAFEVLPDDRPAFA